MPSSAAVRMKSRRPIRPAFNCSAIGGMAGCRRPGVSSLLMLSFLFVGSALLGPADGQVVEGVRHHQVEMAAAGILEQRDLLGRAAARGAGAELGQLANDMLRR